MGAELRTIVELKKIAELLQGHYKECARILTDIKTAGLEKCPKDPKLQELLGSQKNFATCKGFNASPALIYISRLRPVLEALTASANVLASSLAVAMVAAFAQ